MRKCGNKQTVFFVRNCSTAGRQHEFPLSYRSPITERRNLSRVSSVIPHIIGSKEGGFRWSEPPSLFSKTCDLKKNCNAYLMPIFTNFYLNTIIIPNKYMYLKNHVFNEFCTTNRNLFLMKKKLSIFFYRSKVLPFTKAKTLNNG